MKSKSNLKNLPMVLCFLFVVVGGFLHFAMAQQEPGAGADTMSTTLFEGARLIVGDGSAPIENSAFIVDHGRFTKIGRKGDIQLPAGANRVDLTGKTVIPAFINSHNHFGPTRQDYIDQLKILAYNGIAADTDMGQGNWNAFPVKAEAPIDGAQLLPCGRGLVGPLGITPGTIAAGLSGRLPSDLRDPALQVSTPEQGRDHIRELAAEGVNCVKIWVTDRGGTEVQMKPEVYEAIIDEAHKHHLQVYCDMWLLQTGKDLVRAGLDGFAHPVRDKDVDDEFIQILKDHPNVFFQTNLQYTYIQFLAGDPPWLKDPLFLDLATPQELREYSAEGLKRSANGMEVHEGWPSIDPAYGHERFGIMKRNTAKLYKAGVPFAVGTDGGGPKGFSYHVELELLVKEVGLTPNQVITMATRDGARALRLDYLGTVQSGKDASFIVLNANPLDDITNTRKIAKVYLRGHEVDRAGFKAYWQRKHSSSNSGDSGQQ